MLTQSHCHHDSEQSSGEDHTEDRCVSQHCRQRDTPHPIAQSLRRMGATAVLSLWTGAALTSCGPAASQPPSVPPTTRAVETSDPRGLAQQDSPPKEVPSHGQPASKEQQRSEKTRQCGNGTWQTFPTARDAFKRILDENLLVLAIGELHAVRGMPPGATTLHRFRTQMLPVLQGRTKALVLETWAPRGDCGTTEKRAVKQIHRDISSHQAKQAPSELLRLLQAATKQGLSSHVLHPTCTDYKAMRDTKGRLDPVALLTTVGHLLGRETNRALQQIHQRYGALPERHARAGGHGPVVVVYGGAIHNDAHPMPTRAGYSFGRGLEQRLGDDYGELDIIVPELGNRMAEMLRDEPWHPCFAQATETGKAVLVTNTPRSWTIILPSWKTTAGQDKASHQQDVTSPSVATPKAP